MTQSGGMFFTAFGPPRLRPSMAERMGKHRPIRCPIERDIYGRDDTLPLMTGTKRCYVAHPHIDQYGSAFVVAADLCCAHVCFACSSAAEWLGCTPHLWETCCCCSRHAASAPLENAPFGPAATNRPLLRDAHRPHQAYRDVLDDASASCCPCVVCFFAHAGRATNRVAADPTELVF